MTTTNNLGEIFENYLRSGKRDSKGREIGYIVGLRYDGITFYAWVQAARRVGAEWMEFGVAQRSRAFASQASATAWAYSTAKQRIAKIAA